MEPHHVSTLPGGERVVTERIDGVRSASLGLWVPTGARDEPASKAGVSHFIEHLLFKGSARYDALEIAEIFDAMGGELNAATSRETTVVYTRVPDDHVDLALDVMVDMVFAPTFADLDSEREVVLEEIAMVEDAPQDAIHDLAAEAVFGTHPLGRPVIGRAEVIASVSRRSLRSYHAAAYLGGSVVLAAAGNVDHDHVVERLGALRPSQARTVSSLRRKLLGRTPAPSVLFREKDTEQYHVCLSGTGLARDDERRFAGALLDGILGGSASSRLFQEIREKRGMAYSVYSFGSHLAETGQVGVYVGTREDNLEGCFEIVAQQIGDLASGGVREAELSRAKENVKGRLLLSLESTSARMTRLGKSLATDSDLLSIDEVVSRIERVTVDDVTALADELFAPSRLAVAGIGPSERRFRAAAERFDPALEARAA